MVEFFEGRGIFFYSHTFSPFFAVSCSLPKILISPIAFMGIPLEDTTMPLSTGSPFIVDSSSHLYIFI